MKTLNIAVLDYSENSVNFYHGVEIEEKEGVDVSDLAEDWLTKNTGHHPSSRSWMSSEEEITVFENY